MPFFESVAPSEPTKVELPPPPAVQQRGAAAVAQFASGRSVASRSGCLACHRFGDNGADGPGPDLTRIGARLPAAGIAQTLINPTDPMPSFRHLPKRQFDDLVAFLAALR